MIVLKALNIDEMTGLGTTRIGKSRTNSGWYLIRVTIGKLGNKYS
jgi:hypothetical protein